MGPSAVTSNLVFNVWLLALSLAQAGVFVKADSTIPHPCDNVRCPPLSDMTCPADSDIRELIPEPLIAEDEFLANTSSVDITDEIFSQCCLSQKCVCKTCYIPDCQNDGEVVVELQPESMDTPGHCCGKYECHKEPNCTDVQNTDSYWLTNCQRCNCYAGQRICHQSCDEGFKKPTAICHSKNLNQFFEHGDTWKDGCYECECVNGEPNCLINFCRGVNCPTHRQVMLKNSCCPVCWPKGFPMPNTDVEADYEDDGEGEGDSGHHYDDDGGHDYPEQEDNIEPNIELKPIDMPVMGVNVTNNSTGPMSPTTTTTTPAALSTTTTSTSTSTTTTTTTEAPPTKDSRATIAPTIATTLAPVEILKATSSPATEPCKESETINHDGISTTTGPCIHQDSPATYQVYPQVVELMRYSQHNDLLYTIIGCLSVIVIILAAWNIHLKAKQRSYRPVSNLDDNFNTMTSNIKKMNDYA